MRSWAEKREAATDHEKQPRSSSQRALNSLQLPNALMRRFSFHASNTQRHSNHLQQATDPSPTCSQIVGHQHQLLPKTNMWKAHASFRATFSYLRGQNKKRTKGPRSRHYWAVKEGEAERERDGTTPTLAATTIPSPNLDNFSKAPTTVEEAETSAKELPELWLVTECDISSNRLLEKEHVGVQGILVVVVLSFCF